MKSLFAPKPGNIQQTNTPTVLPSNDQNDLNAIEYAQEMLRRSGGNAEAAFYLAAKEKGVDPNKIISRAKSFGDPRAMVQNFLMRNPRMKSLMSLFSMMK